MNKIPEYKVCAAVATKAEQPPEWAKDYDPEMLKVVGQNRKVMPSAGRRVGPRVGPRLDREGQPRVGPRGKEG